MISNAIAEAVLQLHAPIRNLVGVRELLPQLARDAGSRLSGIRDVVLHMLPDYVPDPRRRLNVEPDRAACRQFREKYIPAGLGDYSRMLRDFPELPECHLSPNGPCHWFICHGEFVTITGATKSVTYRDGIPVARCGYIRYCENGVIYDEDAREFVIDGVRYFHPCNPIKHVALPCGLILKISQSGLILMNVATGEFRSIDGPVLSARYYDDYGRYQFGVVSTWESRIYYQ